MDEPNRRRRLHELGMRDPQLATALHGALAASARAKEQRFLEGTLANSLPPPGLVGHKIGGYLVEAAAGCGATASVWRARPQQTGLADPAGGVRTVALKLLHPSLLGSPAAQRLQQEACFLERVHHPHIAALLATGRTQQGLPYLVLEYVQGLPIDQHCDAHRLNLVDRMELALQLMEALIHTHGQQLVHRDIKPANVLVTTAGQVKLLDFGIACGFGAPGSATSATLTRQPRLMTPRYAAPEQILGLAATAATDVYALGVVLYELLCGHSPGGKSMDRRQLLRATLDVDPLPMSLSLQCGGRMAQDIAQARDTPLARLVLQLSGDLQAIVGQALRRDPSQRQPCVAAVAASIRRLLGPLRADLASPQRSRKDRETHD